MFNVKEYIGNHRCFKHDFSFTQHSFESKWRWFSLYGNQNILWTTRDANGILLLFIIISVLMILSSFYSLVYWPPAFSTLAAHQRKKWAGDTQSASSRLLINHIGSISSYSICISVFVFLYLYFCICVSVFVFLHLHVCICVSVIIFVFFL